MYRTGEPRWGDPGDGGFLGMAHAPFRLVGGQGNMTQSDNMTLKGVTLDRLQDRVSLLQVVRHARTARSTSAASWTAWTPSTSRRSASSPRRSWSTRSICRRKTRAWWPATASTIRPSSATARRAWSATSASPAGWSRPGARVVTLNFSRWDWHGPDGKNFVQGRKDMPLLDRAVAALVERPARARPGQGRVGRRLGRVRPHAAHQQETPAATTGRRSAAPCWPAAACGPGQVIGATNRLAEVAAQRPVTFQEVFATLYTSIGLNLSQPASSTRTAGRSIWSSRTSSRCAS